MSAGDINELTIAGHIDHHPWLHYDDDGQTVCEFVLRHMTTCPTIGTWQLEHYSVAIYGERARVFVETYQPGSMLVISGRLQSQQHAVAMWLWRRLGGARRNRPHEYARSRRRTFVIEPIASILATTITTSHTRPHHTTERTCG
jgi:primosomal replication protein N